MHGHSRTIAQGARHHDCQEVFLAGAEVLHGVGGVGGGGGVVVVGAGGVTPEVVPTDAPHYVILPLQL